jgi:hypothetical protein
VALGFLRASNQYLTCASGLRVTDYPFSMGMWTRPNSADGITSAFFTMSDTGTTNNYLEGRINTSEVQGVAATAGGAAATANVATAGTALWTFNLFRMISSTERRIHCITNGLSTSDIRSNVSTTARAPTGMDTISIGGLVTSGGLEDGWDGDLAEYWLATGDVIPAGVVPLRAALNALAYGGPWAHSGVASRLIEYRSFREGLFSKGDVIAHNFTAVNAPKASAHPPLPYWYRRPGQVKTQLVI